MRKALRLLAPGLASVVLFSCGFLQDWESAPGEAGTSQGGVTRLTSTRGGRSAGTCFDNEDCSQLCASMLKDLEDLEKCHRLSEERVQALSDTYELLKTGEARKLERITKEEMEKFLKFGPELWRDAIDGFIVGLKDTRECRTSTRPIPRRCRRDNYYEQRGYTKEGAAAALSWIASSDWLAILLQKHDRKSKENYMVLAALTQVLATQQSSTNQLNYRGKITCIDSGSNSPCPSVPTTFNGNQD